MRKIIRHIFELYGTSVKGDVGASVGQ